MNDQTSNISLTTKDKSDIIESAMSLMHHYLTNNFKCLAEPNFEELFNNHILNDITLQLSNINYDSELDSDNLNKDVKQIIKIAEKMFYTSIIPRRSQETKITRINKEKLKGKIEYLKMIPQPVQRTDEWYDFRHNLITASNAWKCLDTQSSINQIIVEKCKPIDKNKFNSVNIGSPMHWGTKYEEVSVLYYQTKYNLKVDDFGCIKHPKYKFLGASPDGIVVDEKSERYGRMLEIKNPLTRKITGIPKKDYWIQMQLQMETCDLNECDFLETKFEEYLSKEEYLNDENYTTTNIDCIKGKIMCFMKDEKPYYEYPPSLIMNDNEYDEWEKKMMKKNQDLTWIKISYWKLTTISCVLVLRNKLWFENIIQNIEDVWKTIEKERITGYEHRIAKKRDNKNTVKSDLKKPVCLFNIDTNGL